MKPLLHPLQDGKLICVPFFQILGASNCGTTDLYHRLSSHPQVFKGANKVSMHAKQHARWARMQSRKQSGHACKAGNKVGMHAKQHTRWARMLSRKQVEQARVCMTLGRPIVSSNTFQPLRGEQQQQGCWPLLLIGESRQ